jgi:histidine ammonia-lyase
VLAIELLTAARGIELRSPLQPAPATAAALAALRQAGAPAPDTDRWLAPEIDIVVELVASGTVVAAVESVTGSLN